MYVCLMVLAQTQVRVLLWLMLHAHCCGWWQGMTLCYTIYIYCVTKVVHVGLLWCDAGLFDTKIGRNCVDVAGGKGRVLHKESGSFDRIQDFFDKIYGDVLCAYICMYMYTCMHACMYVCTWECVHLCMYIHLHIRYILIYVYMYLHILYIYTHIYKYIYIYIYIWIYI